MLKKVVGIFQAIGTFLSEKLTQLGTLLERVAATLASLPLISLLVGLFNTLKDPIKELLSSIQSGIKAGIDAAVKVATFLWQWVLEPLLQVLSSVALAIALLFLGFAHQLCAKRCRCGAD